MPGYKLFQPRTERIADTMNTKDSELFDDQICAATHQVLSHAEKDFDRPVDALLAHILAVAVMARAVGMGLPSLLGGVTAAYEDLTPADKEDLQ